MHIMVGNGGGDAPLLICILCRVCIKFFLAPGGAEIVGFSFIVALEFCGFFVNCHSADRIDGHRFPSGFPFFAGGIYLFSKRERDTTVTELAAIANAASTGLKV